MRVIVTNIARPKAAAKLILKLKGAGQLAEVHESLAGLMGYNDWYDLTKNGAGSSSGTAVDLVGLRDFTIRVADQFGLPDIDAQYCVTRTRIAGDSATSLNEELALAASVWRARCGSPGRGRPGTVIKVRAHGETRHAYLVEAGRPTRIIYDQSPGLCADFEAVTPRSPLPDFVPKFLWLPYGYWTLRDGSEVVFGREYQPLWHVSGERVRRAEPWERIDHIASRTSFGGDFNPIWSRGEALERALDYLKSRRISGLPRLTNAMPYFLDPSVDHVRVAVDRLEARSVSSIPAAA